MAHTLAVSSEDVKLNDPEPPELPIKPALWIPSTSLCSIDTKPVISIKTKSVQTSDMCQECTPLWHHNRVSRISSPQRLKQWPEQRRPKKTLDQKARWVITLCDTCARTRIMVTEVLNGFFLLAWVSKNVLTEGNQYSKSAFSWNLQGSRSVQFITSRALFSQMQWSHLT